MPAPLTKTACPACGTTAGPQGPCTQCGLDLAPLRLLADLRPAPVLAAAVPAPAVMMPALALGTLGLVAGLLLGRLNPPVEQATAAPPPAPAATDTPAAPAAPPVAPIAQVPAAPMLAYRVRRGDTLSAVAWRFYGDGAATRPLFASNPGVTPRALRIGQTLRIPLADVPTDGPLTLERPRP